MHAKPVRAQQAQCAIELLILTAKLPLEGERLLLDMLPMRKHGRSLMRQHETFAGALKAFLADRVL